jgi:hypothetical protein
MGGGGAKILGQRATFSLGWLNNLPGLGGYCSMVPVLNKISVIYNKEVHKKKPMTSRQFKKIK